MPARDTLFVLRPGFLDNGTRWFCPFAAQVMGFLHYYPAVRDTLDLVEVDFPRPRQAIIDLIGDAYQSTPVLILADGAAPAEVAGVQLQTGNGRSFVAKTIEILRYLAATRGVPGPH